MIADDRYVVAHYRMTETPGDPGVAVVDIWRFENGLIVEHWDVMQAIPEASGMI